MMFNHKFILPASRRLLMSLAVITIAAGTLSSQARAAVYVNETFDDGDVIGTNPSDSAQTSVTDNVLVATGNAVIGTDNVADFLDESAASGQYLEYNAGPSGRSNLYMSFDIYNKNPTIPGTNASGTNQITFSVGVWDDGGGTKLNSNSKRSFLIDLYHDGDKNTLKVRNDVATVAQTDYDFAELQSFQIWANDNDSNPINYVRPDNAATQSLNANSFVVWVNGILISDFATGDVMSTSGTGDTTGNAVIGRLGFITTSTTEANFLIDNVYASDIPTATIPEPMSLSLAGFGLLMMLNRRSR